ncbi:MAG TPA: DUF6069 family protein [Reyranella sp.]|nr:DUF6069 family protein [Reyranella sp.]
MEIKMNSSAFLDAPPQARGIPWVLRGVALAAVAAVALNSLIMVLGTAAGASTSFAPLQPASYIALTVFGVVAGAVGWAIVRRATARPRVVLRALVPIMLALSLIPDVLLLVSNVQPNTSGVAVATLMAMHVATAAIAVFTFARVMPLEA